MRWINKFVRDDEAATAVEYAVLLALILLVVIGAIRSFGGAQAGLWGNTYTELQNAGF